MKILVTGAAGQVGRAVARDLLANGHEVRVFDCAPFPADLRAACEVVYGDLTERFDVLRAVDGVEAIAHLAAIPNPVGNKALTLFAPNVLGTQHIFAAAEGFEIKRVVLASSCTIYGFVFHPAPYGQETLLPQYLPLNEAHPIAPADVYALSKQCNEATAATYTARCGMATTCLRLTWVSTAPDPQNPWHRRQLERGGMGKSRDMWGYVDERDAGRAFRLALENLESGHHVAQITARDYWSAWPARKLIQRHYPQFEHFLDEIEISDWNFERDGFWDSRHAEQLFGWKSQFHWRDIPEWADIEPKFD